MQLADVHSVHDPLILVDHLLAKLPDADRRFEPIHNWHINVHKHESVRAAAETLLNHLTRFFPVVRCVALQLVRVQYLLQQDHVELVVVDDEDRNAGALFTLKVVFAHVAARVRAWCDHTQALNALIVDLWSLFYIRFVFADPVKDLSDSIV